MEDVMYYVGCQRESGHYLFKGGGHSGSLDFNSTPWGYSADGGLAPAVRTKSRSGGGREYIGREAPQGVCAVHHKEGWTAIAFWDRSIDGRPHSNSGFFAMGQYSFDEMIQLAKKHYPSVMERFDFVLTEDDGAWRTR